MPGRIPRRAGSTSASLCIFQCALESVDPGAAVNRVRSGDACGDSLPGIVAGRKDYCDASASLHSAIRQHNRPELR